MQFLHLMIQQFEPLGLRDGAPNPANKELFGLRLQKYIECT